MLQTIKTGNNYAQIFPRNKGLKSYFWEYHAIQLFNHLVKLLPPILALILVWGWLVFSNDTDLLANVVVAFLFAVSLPVQILFLLGKRANMPLPLKFLALYQKLQYKLNAENFKEIKTNHSTTLPNFYNLAILLQRAENKFGANFLDDLDQNN